MGLPTNEETIVYALTDENNITSDQEIGFSAQSDDTNNENDFADDSTNEAVPSITWVIDDVVPGATGETTEEGELPPNIPDVDPTAFPVPTYSTITVKTRSYIFDYSPENLQSLQEAGGVFYAIYEDGTEDLVSIDEVSEPDLSSTAVLAFDADAIGAASNQHFWDDDNGIHVTNDTKEVWNAEYLKTNHGTLGTPTDLKPWHNILINSLGLLLRRGLLNLAAISKGAIYFYDGQGNSSSNIMSSFGLQRVQIGKDNAKHIVLDTNGLTAYNADGSIAPITGIFDGANISNSSINASSIDTSTFTNGSISGSVIDTSTFVNGSISGSKIDSSTLTNIPYAEIDQLKALGLTAQDINAAAAFIAALAADSITANDISADHASVASLEADNISVKNRLTAAEADIDDLEADNITVNNRLTATEGDIDTLVTENTDVKERLTAAEGNINTLTTENVTVNNRLTAAEADIDTLEADNVTVKNRLTAAEGDIETLNANKATVVDLEAATARISQLETDKADISVLESDYITADVIESRYTKTDFSNANVAWIQNGTIKNGSISDAMINSVSANKLTAGTIDASVITVTNLQAEDISVSRINGQTVAGKNLTDALAQHETDISGLDNKIDTQVEALNDRIDGAIETFTGTAVPTLNNTPASSWNTTKLRDQHVGDVYYVVNSNSQQNGYCYRFTKSGSTYSWQLIKDSDVTAALARLQTAEGKIGTIEQFDSDISAWKTDTDEELASMKTAHNTLAGRVTTAEGTLATKVDSTTFNTLSQTVDSNSSSITQLTTTTTELRNDFDNLEVGGRNLLLAKARITYDSDSYLVYQEIPTSIALNELTEGESLVLQMWDVELDENSTGIRVYWGGGTLQFTSYLKPDANGYISTVITPTASNLSHSHAANKHILVYNFPNANHENPHLSIGRWKLERGTIPTDWTPAPEDLERKPNILRGTNQMVDVLPFSQSTECLWSEGKWAAGSGDATNGNAEVVEVQGAPDGQLYAFHVWSVNSNNKDICQREIQSALSPNTQYRVSFYARLTPDVEQESASAQFRMYGYANATATSSSALKTQRFTITHTEWRFYSYQFSFTEAQFANDNQVKTFMLGVYGKGDLQFCGVKLEQSEYPTPWAPSAFDNPSITSINTISNRVSEVTHTIEGIDTRIGSLETTIVTKADGSDLTTVTNRLNTVSDTVDGHTQSITSINNTLATKADGSTVTALDTKVNNISDTVDGHTSSLQHVTEVQTQLRADIDGIEVGGRNLLVGTQAKLPRTGTSSSYFVEFNVNNSYLTAYELEEGVTYTFSLDVTSSREPFIVSVGAGNGTLSKDIKSEAHLTSGRVSVTFTPTAAQLANGNIFAFRAPRYSSQGTSFTYTVDNIKLERGNKATDWTPAPEDVDAAIAAVPRIGKINAPQKSGTTEQWKTWGAFGYTGTWTTGSTYDNSHLRVGDTAYVTGTVSDGAKGSCTIIGVVTAVNGTNGTTSIGLRSTQLIFGGDSVANVNASLTATQTDYAEYKQTTEEFKSTVGSTYATKVELNDLSIGGRNLLKNSLSIAMVNSDRNNKTDNSKPKYTWTRSDNGEVHSYTFADSGASGNSNNAHNWIQSNYSPGIVEMRGREYAWGLDIKVDGVANFGPTVYAQFDIDMRPSSANQLAPHAVKLFLATDISDGVWTHIGGTGVVGENDTFSLFEFEIVNLVDITGPFTVSYRRPIVVYGNKIPADWIPAPEDTDASITAIESRVTNAETSIDQNRDEIALRAKSSDVYTKQQSDGLISTEVTNRNAAITAATEAIELSVSENYTTKQEFSDLEIGGTNLLTCSAENWVRGSVNSTTGVPSSTTSRIRFPQGKTIAVEPGATYVISRHTVDDVEYDFAFYGYDSDGTYIKSDSKTTWQTSFPMTWTPVTATQMLPLIRHHDDSVISPSDAAKARFKIEKGTLPTDWSPAPEDMASQADLTEAKAAIKVTTDGISSEVGKISSAKYVNSTTPSWTLTAIKSYAAEGSLGNWAVASTSNIRVGDTVYIKGTDSTRSCPVYIKVTVDAINSATQLHGISHGYEDVLPVDTIKSTINQSSDSVKIQAKHVEIDGAAIFSNSDFREAADAVYDAKGAAASAVSGITIGGRNLLRDSRPIKNFGTTEAAWVSDGLTASISDNAMIIDGSVAATGNKRVYQSTSYFTHSASTEYVFSCDIVATATCAISFGRRYGSTNNYGVTFNVTTTKQRLSGTYTATGAGAFCISAPSNSATVTVSNFKLEIGNKATDWTPAPEDSNEAVVITQRIYHRKSVTGAPAVPTAWVTTETNVYNAWTTKVPPLAASNESGQTKYPYLYTCEQRKRLDGTVECTKVLLDENTTVIDGGTIITNSITANKLDAETINASGMLTVGSMTAATQKAIDNSNVVVGGRNLLLKTANEKSQLYSSTTVMFWRFAFEGSLPQGEYTLSFDMKSSNGTDKFYASVSAGSSTKQRVAENVTPGTSYSRYSVTFNYTQTATSTGVLITSCATHGGGINEGNDGTVYIKNIKLEIGNRATDYTEAPEDIAADISTAQTTADTANNKLVAFRGVCGTAAGTAAKVVACEGFELVQGYYITVYNTVANTSSGALTLNVNSKGAKPIYVAGAATSTSNKLLWTAGSTVTYVYDGAEFRVADNPPALYGTACTVAEGSASKTTTSNDCVIFKGAQITVPMSYSNTATGAVLNVSGLGSGPIYYGTSSTVPTKANGYAWPAGAAVIFTFDGSNWRTGNQTFIDGGNILTGTIAADRIKANVISAVNGGTGTINADKINATDLHVDAANIDGTLTASQINATGLTIGYSQIDDPPTIPSKVSDLTNDRGYQTATQVDTAITGKGYQTATQVDTAIENKGYQTATQVDTAIENKGYQTATQVDTAIESKGYSSAIADAAKSVVVQVSTTSIDYSAGTATLQATLYVDGTAKTSGVTYKWFSDGTAITSNGTARTLSVTAAMGLNHVYSCEVTY